MELVSRLDEFGKPAWIVLMILGFWLRWPIGLAILAFLIFSGRFKVWKQARGQWYNTAQQQPAGPGAGPGTGWGPLGGKWGCGASASRAPASGNRAFDEYRAETLRRLEEEQQEFQAYLERLRQARDKQEFDQFMAERRNRPGMPTNTNGPTETV